MISSRTGLPTTPFRGIDPFRYVDNTIFFARDEETKNLVRLITIYRAVLLYGDSGVGKSSLINAGFFPAISDKFAPHRVRLHRITGEEIIIERISESTDGTPPYLPSLFNDPADEAAQSVLAIEEFKRKLTPFRIWTLEDRIAMSLKRDADLLSQHLKRKITEETRRMLDQYDIGRAPPDNLRMVMMRDLKRLIYDESLYDEKRFAHITLGEETKALLLSHPTGEAGAYLNRFLLEEAYPTESPGTRTYPLLIFDQFEELVTLFEVAPTRHELKEALAIQAEILDLLVELIRDESVCVKLLFSFREDYLAKLTKLFTRCPELTDQYLRLTPVQTQKLDKIIHGPFTRHPGFFVPEFPLDLVKKLQDAITERSESGAINLTEVEVACLRLWQSADPVSEFKKKTLQGLLEDYLADALSQLSDDLRLPAVALLTRLVTSAGTRNVISEDDLLGRVEAEDGLARELLKDSLERLEKESKLVRRELRRDVYFYEIVSEFLIPWIRAQWQEQQRRKYLQTIIKNLPCGSVQVLSTGTTHMLSRSNTISIGRSASGWQNDIDLQAQPISRIHLLISNNHALDMRSKYGTTLNAELIRYLPAKGLRDGDIIVLAGVAPLQFQTIQHPNLDALLHEDPSRLEPTLAELAITRRDGSPLSGWGMLIDGKARKVKPLSALRYFLALNDADDLVLAMEGSASCFLEIKKQETAIQITSHAEADDLLLFTPADDIAFDKPTQYLFPDDRVIDIVPGMTLSYRHIPFQIVPIVANLEAP